MVMLIGPVLLIERDRLSVVVTGVSRNVNDVGLKKANGELAVPDKPMSCGERSASS